MPQRRNTRRRDPHKNGRMTKRQVSRKNGRRKKRRTRKRTIKRTRRSVRKNQRGGHLSVANIAVLAALGLWFNGDFDDLLVGPLTDMRPKELKKVLKKGKRSIKKKLDISSPLDKTLDALDKVKKKLD